MTHLPQSRFRLLALDLDGTLLDPDGRIAPDTEQAIGRVVQSGIRPILCTGRRPRRTIPIARELGLTYPIVCNSGALISSAGDPGTIWRADLDRPVVDAVLAVFRAFDQPAISFLDRPGGEADFVVAVPSTGRPLIDDFLDQNREFASVVPGWADEVQRTHFHLTAIGTRPAMLELERALHQALGGQVQTFVQKSPSYAGTMCEVLRADANKWSAILRLCSRWQILPSEVCAVGDDMNDIPMIRGAGLGVAMGHAPPAVVAAADLVVRSNAAGGVAQLIDEFILGGPAPGREPS